MLKFTNITNLIVHVYEGDSRNTAINSITEFNEEPTVDDMYRVKWNSGMLLVAVPLKDSQTNMEFTYWIE